MFLPRTAVVTVHRIERHVQTIVIVVQLNERPQVVVIHALVAGAIYDDETVVSKVRKIREHDRVLMNL